MQAVDGRLVRRDAGLIQLFDPPFDKSSLNPGYIKGYFPGVRENGGQYTHGAIWTAIAFALMGDTDRAWDLFALLNPVHHSATSNQIATYKVEPYVIAADIYAVAPHIGRGGWTWYTGSAGWMYRLLLETLLGVNLEGNQLRLTPSMPRKWSTFTVHYRYRQTPYHIRITRLPSAPSVAAAYPSTVRRSLVISSPCWTTAVIILWKWNSVNLENPLWMFAKPSMMIPLSRRIPGAYNSSSRLYLAMRSDRYTDPPPFWLEPVICHRRNVFSAECRFPPATP